MVQSAQLPFPKETLTSARPKWLYHVIAAKRKNKTWAPPVQTVKASNHLTRCHQHPTKANGPTEKNTVC